MSEKIVSYLSVGNSRVSGECNELNFAMSHSELQFTKTSAYLLMCVCLPVRVTEDRARFEVPINEYTFVVGNSANIC